MNSKRVFPPSPFIVITKPKDIRGHRTAVALHVAKLKEQRKTYRTLNLRPDQIPQNFLAWRTANTSSGSASNMQSQANEQALAEFINAVRSVPASLQAMYSLQNFFETNPALYYPAQILLDAGNSHALAFFSTVDLRGVYHAVLSVLLGWLHLQYPSQNPLSAALFHQTQALTLLRQRLSQGQYDDETYLILLCALQTDALLGNQKALMIHQRGLQALSSIIEGKLNEYCKALKPKHDFLITEAGKQPYFSREDSMRETRPLHYLELPYSMSVTEMLSCLPIGQQQIANEYKAISEELMITWAMQTRWRTQIAFNMSSDHERHDVRSSGFVYAMMRDVWSILERTDPEAATLERFICMSLYISLLCQGYRRIVQNSPIFRQLSSEASRFICKFNPQTQAEFQCLLRYSMPVIDAWKTEVGLGNEGLQLVRNIKDRFPVTRHWDAVEAVLQKFPSLPTYTAEWRQNWLQSS